MTNDEKCFVNMLRCFLNNEKPESAPSNWGAVIELANLNDVAGVIAHEMKLLPNPVQPTGVLRSYMLQTLGLTVKRVSEYEVSQQALFDFLEKNGVDYMLVKGAAIRPLYPAPELRTSGDIDVIVREDEFLDIVELFKSSAFHIKSTSASTLSVEIDELIVELHKGADVFGYYFDGDIFEGRVKNGTRYALNGYDQLLYVLLHLVKHLKDRGAGVRMLMDIDVCIRDIEGFDEARFFDMCDRAGVGKCAKALLSLANAWFGTPVNSYYDFAALTELYDMLTNCFLHGGVFGYNNNNLGNHYVAKYSKGERITLLGKIKALKRLILPPAIVIKSSYLYVHKHSFLLPIGYVHRFIEGVFVRGGHSLKTAQQIMESSDAVLTENQLINELELID